MNLRNVFGAWVGLAFIACKGSDPDPSFPTPPVPPPETSAGADTSAEHELTDTPVPEQSATPQNDIFAPGKPPDQEAQEDPNLYPTLVDVIKQSMPTADRGSALAVRFVNTQTNFRYSSGFVSDAGFVPFKGFPGQAIAIAVSEAGETFTIVMSKSRPGHYECKTDTFAIEFAPANVKGTDDGAAWSDNVGGDCEVDLYAGQAAGDLQGKLSGKLVSNDGTTTFTLEAGYFYARKPFLAGTGNATGVAAPHSSQPPPPQVKPKFTH